jgi:hypothetical protein
MTAPIYKFAPPNTGCRFDVDLGQLQIIRHSRPYVNPVAHVPKTAKFAEPTDASEAPLRADEQVVEHRLRLGMRGNYAFVKLEWTARVKKSEVDQHVAATSDAINALLSEWTAFRTTPAAVARDHAT